MDEWDREVFSEQLKKSGNHPDSEYIDVDEDPDTQIDREMERLAIAESQLADTPCFAGSILILFLVTFHLITSRQMLVLYHFIQFGSHASRAPSKYRNVTVVTAPKGTCRNYFP